MALVACQECGKEISDKAMACPGCGCPVEVKIKLRQWEEYDDYGLEHLFNIAVNHHYDVNNGAAEALNIYRYIINKYPNSSEANNSKNKLAQLNKENPELFGDSHKITNRNDSNSIYTNNPNNSDNDINSQYSDNKASVFNTIPLGLIYGIIIGAVLAMLFFRHNTSENTFITAIYIAIVVSGGISLYYSMTKFRHKGIAALFFMFIFIDIGEMLGFFLAAIIRSLLIT